MSKCPACNSQDSYVIKNLAEKTGSKLIVAGATKSEDKEKLITHSQELLGSILVFVLDSIGL